MARKKETENIDVEKLMDALDSVTWYNGLFDTIAEWKKIGPFEGPPSDYGGHDEKEREQLQVIWMICVCLFGDYGTSPRFGWIEDQEAFYEFIDRITMTSREAKGEQ